MKELGKVTELLLMQVFNAVTYPSIKNVAGSLEKGHFSEDGSELVIPKADLTAALFATVLEMEDYTVRTLVGDVGIEEFCNRWVVFIVEVNDHVRQGASGELENLNMKINLILNKLLED